MSRLDLYFATEAWCTHDAERGRGKGESYPEWYASALERGDDAFEEVAGVCW